MVFKPITTKWNPAIDNKPISDAPGTKFIRRLTNKHITSDTRHILDLGCGTGSYTCIFDKHYCCVGLDLDPNALKVAKRYCANSDFIAASISHLPFRDETFDFAVILGVMEELEKGGEMQVLAEVYRVLTISGRLLLLTANDHIVFKIMNPAFFFLRQRHYNAKKLTQSIKESRFSIEECIIRGGCYSLIAISIFYFHKHILHKSESNLLRYIYKKMDKEFESNKKGICRLFIAAKKEAIERGK